jgi:hypothetical protein
MTEQQALDIMRAEGLAPFHYAKLWIEERERRKTYNVLDGLARYAMSQTPYGGDHDPSAVWIVDTASLPRY